MYCAIPWFRLAMETSASRYTVSFEGMVSVTDKAKLPRVPGHA